VDKKVKHFVCRTPYVKGKDLNKFILGIFSQVVEKHRIDTITVEKYRHRGEDHYFAFSIFFLRSMTGYQIATSEDSMLYVDLEPEIANHLFVDKIKEGDIIYLSLPVKTLSVKNVYTFAS